MRKNERRLTVPSSSFSNSSSTGRLGFEDDDDHDDDLVHRLNAREKA